MFSRIWIMNGGLAILLVFCVVNIFKVLNAEKDVVPGADHVVTDSRPADFPKMQIKTIAPEAKYSSIVDKNLFSSDRRFFVPEKEEAAPVIEDVKISGEKVVLFGVIIADDYKTALINNPENRSGDAMSKWVREGDRIGNLKIIEIHPAEISLNDGANKYKISLYDPEKSSKMGSADARQNESPGQPKVISTGGGQADKTRQSSNQTEKIDQADDGAEYEIINTPFGKIKRKKQ